MLCGGQSHLELVVLINPPFDLNVKDEGAHDELLTYGFIELLGVQQQNVLVVLINK